MKSFENYAFDCFLRSFENKESFLEQSGNYSSKEKVELLHKVYGDLNFFESAYNAMDIYLHKKVKIVLNDKPLKIDKVEFHSKYGWVVSSNGKKAFLGKASIYGELNIIIGHRSYISGNCHLRGIGTLSIGKYTSIGWNLYVFVEYENHPFDYPGNINFSVESRLIEDNMSLPIPNPVEAQENKVSIGNDVFIGRNVNIMNGVTIKDGCVIGANTMVTKDCEPFGIYVGTPARLIKKRFSEKIINQMIELEWWNWPFERIKQNSTFFSTNLTNYSGDISEIVV